jgi:hypothetical protein
MQRPMRAMIAGAFCGAIGALSSQAAGPYDGTWSGQAPADSDCVNVVVTLMVVDGNVSGGAGGGGVGCSFRPGSKVGSDGSVFIMCAAGHSLSVTFAGDRFEARTNFRCGRVIITGNRTSH